MFRIKRVYLPAAVEDGLRVLVDGLWPRGLSRDTIVIHQWLREVAPSPELRRWFGHDAERWQDFIDRYRKELATPERASALERLQQAGQTNRIVTLLYAARDETHNHAAFLAEFLNVDQQFHSKWKES